MLPHDAPKTRRHPAKRSLVMRLVHRSRLGRLAIIASGAMLLSGGAFAQTVQVFDDAPSLEQLRSIMIPESHPGTGRTIVIQRPDAGATSSSVQRASTQVLPAPRTPVTAANMSAPPVERVAASVSVPSRPAAQEPAPAEEAGAVAFHVNFAFDSAALPDSARSMIDMIAQLLKEAPDLKVRVEGHTDAVGSVNYNVTLSERRALSVGEYLAKQGVEPSRLILVGKGMAEPLTHNPYDPTNRRVQFVRVS
jgi:outer membrane protein OmpA-like peptidoglycan-associated protein